MLRLLLPNSLATPLVELGAGDWLNLFPASRIEPGSHDKGMPGARSFSRRTQAQYARSFSTSKKELPRCLPNFNISRGAVGRWARRRGCQDVEGAEGERSLRPSGAGQDLRLRHGAAGNLEAEMFLRSRKDLAQFLESRLSQKSSGRGDGCGRERRRPERLLQAPQGAALRQDRPRDGLAEARNAGYLLHPDRGEIAILSALLCC